MRTRREARGLSYRGLVGGHQGAGFVERYFFTAPLIRVNVIGLEW